MFFDILSALCAKKGISAYKACTDMGLNRSAVAKWKNGSTPNGATISKMADYFGVTTDYLLGTDPEDTSTKNHKNSRSRNTSNSRSASSSRSPV